MTSTIKILKKVSETKTASTFYFECTNESIQFKSGQFITLHIQIGERIFKRAYSLSSFPGDGLSITIQKVSGGLVSNYMVDKVEPGDIFTIDTPMGKFVLDRTINHHVFLAAGSGLTPIFSMIQDLLENDPLSTVYLLLSAKDQDRILFEEKLSNYARIYIGQFYMDLVLTGKSQKFDRFLDGFLKNNKKSNFNVFSKRRLDFQTFEDWLQFRHIDNEQSVFYVCGPEEFIESNKYALSQIEIDPKRIRSEYFTNIAEESTSSANKFTLKLKLEGQNIETTIQSDETILQRLLDLGFDPPYSCQNGSCSTCIAKLITGQVSMKNSSGLSGDEEDQGFILTCQAKVTGDPAEVNY